MNSKAVKRLEHQIYLAKENPEPVYDVSNCELITVPVGCFSLCKVLRKKKLFLNNNHIKILKSNGNNIQDLTVLTHLYLEHNNLENLPDDINSIQYLQVLNISHNRISSLPASLGQLLYLSQFYVQNNDITGLPQTLFTSNSNLEIIDVSENRKFCLIPIEITNLPKLRKFNCSVEFLIFPSQDICQQGLIAILQELCKTCGCELSQLFIDKISTSCEHINSDFVDISILDFEKCKQDRLQLLKSIEAEYEAIISYQKSFANKALSDRNEFLRKLFEEEAKNISDISLMHKERDQRKEQLINDVKAAENDAANLIEEIMAINKKCQSQEKFLDEIENESVKKYQLYQISREEYGQLRRQEILNAMSKILISQDTRCEDFYEFKDHIKPEFMPSMVNQESVSEVFNERSLRQKNILHHLENEEKEQKAAFQQLQLQKDIRTLRLTEHIYSVESELILLSQVEQKKRAEKEDFIFTILNERRKQLAEILENFIQQKELRERILLQRMLEIEQQRQQDQTDFWLIQYQRCLDNKPNILLEKTINLDEMLKLLLNRVNATEYLPFFVQHKITWNQVEQFQENDWMKIGILNSSLSKRLCETVKEIQKERKESKFKESVKESSNSICVPDECKEFSIYTSPITSHREIECCICLNESTNILFMPCAHICCCEKCSNNLKECPLCRSKITRVIRFICW